MQEERHNVLVLDNFCPQFLMRLKSKPFLLKSKRTQFAGPARKSSGGWKYSTLPWDTTGHSLTILLRGSDILQHIYLLISVQNMEIYLLFINQVKWIVLNCFCLLFPGCPIVNSSVINSIYWFYLHHNIIFWSFIQIKREWIRTNYRKGHLTTLPFNISERYSLRHFTIHWCKKKIYFYISITMLSRCLTSMKKVTSSQIAEVYLGKKG